MAACVFFSNSKDKSIHPDILDMANVIEEIFRDLILNKDVNLFYTPGETLFDLTCAETVAKLKEKYNREYYGIQLIKIVAKDDIEKETPPMYDRYCYFKSNEYKDKCAFALRIGDFIVLDTLYLCDEKDMLFPYETIGASLKHDDGEMNDLKLYTI